MGATLRITCVFGRCEDDQDGEISSDGMKTVRYAGTDEEDRTFLDLRLFSADCYGRCAAEHNIDLVLGVRLLMVHAARRQHIQPCAQRRHAQKLEVWPSRL